MIRLSISFVSALSLYTVFVLGAPALHDRQVTSSSASSIGSTSLSTGSSSASLSVGTSSGTSTAVSSVTSVFSSVLPTTSLSATTTTSSDETPSGTDSAPPAITTVPFVDLVPNPVLWDPLGTDGDPDAVRGSLGATILGPTNEGIERENPDLLAPPTTDSGSIGNAKWPFSLSHNRLQTGGWARNQNVAAMPLASQMAGVNMRLEAGAVRELHWHKTAEWAYVLSGSTQISSVDAQGRNYIATANKGDLWYFPPGIPHALQATNDDPAGSEFLLVFDDGAFSEDSTFLLTDWLAHIPAEVIEKNFAVNSTAFDHIPSEELYIFPAGLPEPDSAAPVSPQGTVPDPFTFALSQVKATQLNGGTVKVVDSSSFKISKTIAAAEVTVEPGAMRELHWHPTQDEWSFFISGEARVTIFASQGIARTFNYQAGDIGYVPQSMGHYVENIGNTTLEFLEIFKSDRFEDISLNQWLALTPPKLVKAHLGLDDDTIAHLSKTKNTIISGSKGST